MEIQNPSVPIETAKNEPSQRLATGSQILGKDEFLQLLVTQMSNQDPLNPLDGQDFAAQLAQFSSVEQLINIESALTNNGTAIDVLSQTTNAGIASGLIGKDIEAPGNQLHWDGEGERNLTFDLGQDATQVTISIRDGAGNVIRTLELGPQSGGRHTVSWDGTDTAGANAAVGPYTFEVTATDSKGDAIEATELVTGPVDRVTFGPEGILLWLGKVPVPLANVSGVED